MSNWNFRSMESKQESLTKCFRWNDESSSISRAQRPPSVRPKMVFSREQHPTTVIYSNECVVWTNAKPFRQYIPEIDFCGIAKIYIQQLTFERISFKLKVWKFLIRKTIFYVMWIGTTQMSLLEKPNFNKIFGNIKNLSGNFIIFIEQQMLRTLLHCEMRKVLSA